MVIMLAARYLSELLPMQIAILLSPVITLPIAALVNKFVEQPAIRLASG